MEQIPQGDWSRSPCGMRQALPARLRMHILAAVTGKAITSGRGCRKSPSFLIPFSSRARQCSTYRGAGEDAAFYPLRRFASAPLEKQGEPRVRREPGAGRRYVQRFPEAGMIWYDNYRGIHNVLKKIDIFNVFGLTFTSTDGKMCLYI